MKVMAISAHPDDIEINCAGTLARFRERGDDVVMCNLCNGNLGHVEIMPDELRNIRNAESKKSAALLGAEHISMDIGDLSLYAENREQREKLTELIRYVKPDVIITHTPEDYMADHVAVSKLVFAATFCASLPHYKISKEQVADICPVFYMDNLGGFKFEPTEYVDISKFIELKIEMLNCHQSQVRWMKEHDGIDFPDIVRTFSKMRGIQCGVGYAEGFRQMTGWGRMTTKRLLP